MAIEMHVFFRGKLPDKRALSQAMAELGFPFSIAAGSLERQNGFMPMRLRREKTGVEFNVYNDRAAVEELAGSDIDPAFERSANFRWSSDEDEMLAGLCAAAALAKLVSGVVLEETEDRLLSPDEAIALARETLSTVLKPEDSLRRGTRPADLKRYLKSLLKQRSDLVLIDRMLLIRPVRHILRGVFLDRTGDKYHFRMWPYLNSLWHPNPGLDTFRYLDPHLWYVWQPHFETLLIDTLGQDIFAPFGAVTNLEEFADALPDDRFYGTRVSALLLAGARERAEEVVRNVETHKEQNTHWQQWAKAQRDLLARDIAEVCAAYHAVEAETVKSMKLDSIWEPSPFPVEVSAVERRSQAAEPLFTTDPWPLRPPDLLVGVPQEPGKVLFAKTWRFRGSRNPTLVIALSREEAEERHRNGEDYVLATRLAGGLLVFLQLGGRDRREPGRAQDPNPDPTVYRRGLRLGLHGVQFFAEASFYVHPDVEYLIEASLIGVDERATQRDVWSSHLDSDENTLEIWDHRGDGSKQKKKVSGPDMERFQCPSPNFGEFEPVVHIVLSVLRSEGYGELS